MPLFGPPDIEKMKAKKDVDGLVKALSYQKDANVRRNAVDALSEIGDRSTVERMIPMLNDGDINVRAAAAVGLGRLGDVSAVDPLLVAFQARLVTRQGAEALGKLRDPRAIGTLCEALRENDIAVSSSASKALVEIGALAVPPLMELLGDKDKYVRKYSAQTLNELKWEPGKDAIGATYWIARGYFEKCVEIGAPSFEALIAFLGDKDDEMRKAAAEALGQLGDERAVEPLIELYKTSIHSVRLIAIKALGKIRDPWAIETLIAAIDDSMEDTGLEAIRSLSLFDDPRVSVALVNVLGKEGSASANLRAKASVVLRKLGESAVSPLIAALVRPFSQFDVITLLTEIGEPALDPLISNLSHGLVRLPTTRALVKINDPRVFVPFLALLDDEDIRVRREAASGLVNLYKAGKLEQAQKETLLTKREEIVKKHVDQKHEDVIKSHEDGHNDFSKEGCLAWEPAGTTSGHTDNSGGHTDVPGTNTGIGVDFPL